MTEQTSLNSSLPPAGGKILYNASLSTMWGVMNCSSLEEMFDTAKQMGFASLELNHMIDSSMIDGVNLEGSFISSIHEPCPADVPAPALKTRDWLASSIDEERRQKGVQAIRRSIDLAHRLNVRTIVMHCGQVQSAVDYEKSLRDLYRQGQADTDEFRSLKALLVEERLRGSGACFSAVKRSLAELLEYADAFGVCIGLENRFHYLDIPNPDEMQELLEMAGEKRLGYIHDTGHAQAMDRLGFFCHETWLERFSKRMVGAHLHDAVGIDDHYAPGMGEIDFSGIARYLPAGAFRTCEIHGKHTVRQLANGLLVLKAAGCIEKIE